MPHTIVIFGASGDLTRRKLIPALYRLFRKNRLPEQTRVVGFSRTEMTHDQFRAGLAGSTESQTAEMFDQASWQRFAESIYYVAGDIGDSSSIARLSRFTRDLEQGAESTRIYYLATLPRLYETAVRHLGELDLADESQGPRRLVVEKPFGNDLNSAQDLNSIIHSVFSEHQVYRIDHYLGKETVQNLLVLRFANSIFEPLWNRHYVDHVQITVAESLDVSSRGAYYDQAGVLRDMFQNHLLQLLMVTAMEAPVRFEADLVRDEKVKVLQAMRPITQDPIDESTVRGQYQDYRRHDGVAADSPTETFAVVRCWIDNWRWKDVPFYLRSGKALSCRSTQIVIQFRHVPHMLFQNRECRPLEANRLVIQIQPAEGIQLHFLTKVPDAGMRLRLTDLDFRFDREFPTGLPDAYQRLLLDVLQGDASLFARSDEVELSWEFIDPILAAWRSPQAPPLYLYEPGEWGPDECRQWLQQQGRQWFDVCPVLH